MQGVHSVTFAARKRFLAACVRLWRAIKGRDESCATSALAVGGETVYDFGGFQAYSGRRGVSGVVLSFELPRSHRAVQNTTSAGRRGSSRLPYCCPFPRSRLRLWRLRLRTVRETATSLEVPPVFAMYRCKSARRLDGPARFPSRRCSLCRQPTSHVPPPRHFDLEVTKFHWLCRALRWEPHPRFP